MKRHLLIYLLLQGVLLYDALAWSVNMPSEIYGTKGSCLVIPCSFYYSSYPPENPRRVVWYQWASSGYPLVYDPWYPNDVIEMFRWKTKLYGDPSRGDCSLLIKNLDWSHSGERLYAWIDPENVGWRTFEFYKVTSTVFVGGSPQQPSISIYGGERTGDSITVECSTSHSCPYSKPSITLSGIDGTDQIWDQSFNNGRWKTTLTRTGVVKSEHLTIRCVITHYGGITVTATKHKSAQCVPQKISIEPKLPDVTVGIAKKFTCSVHHFCQNEPTITWNYKNMQVIKKEKTFSGLNWISSSNIDFMAAKEDNGKQLICAAKYSGRDVQTSVILHVQRVHQKIMIEPEMADVTVGIAKKFTCSVYHSCQEEPTITWNYKNMQVTTEEKTLSGLNWVSYSNITFMAAKEDNGKELICTAKFSGGDITTSVVLHGYDSDVDFTKRLMKLCHQVPVL
ncbi:sialoadhesin-like [Garra rufa]|uniref:sialoadhesin-like n=1 Tax=Garra rufa TaxID=137080 RepID=UPI003CCE64F0